MMEAMGPAGGGPGAAGSGHGFSGAKMGEGLYKVFMKTGNIGSASEAGAKDRITYDQEFNWQDAIIPYEYKVVKERWTNQGRTLEEINDPNEVGGDRIKRFLEAEQKMTSDSSIRQVAIGSENLGYGRNYLYLLTRDSQDESKINALAIEHQGTNSEFLGLMGEVGKKAVNSRGDSRLSISFETPLYFTETNKIDVGDVFHAVKASYTTEKRRQEMQPFLQRLARDTVRLPQLVEERRRQEEELARQVEKEVRILLKNRDTQTAFGIVGQGLAEIGRQLEEKEGRKELNFQQPMDNVRVSGQSVKQKQLGEIPISSGYNIDPLRKFYRRHRGHSGGRGFRRYRIWGELEQTGGISPIYRRRNLTAKEAAEQLDFVNKAKKSSDAYLFLKKGSLADALLKGEVVVKKTEKDNNQDNRIYKTTEKSQIQRKKARSKDTLVYSVKKDSEGQISVKPEVAVSGEKQIFVAKARKPIKIDLRMGGAKERLQKKSQNKTRVSELRSERERIISLAKREKRTLKKQEKMHLIQKSKKEAKKLVRREVLARRKNEIKKKLALETRKQKRIEKKMRKEVRRLRKSLKLIDRISRLAAKDKFDKTTDRKLTRKKLLKLARVLWGKESGIYEKFKEGKVSRKMIKRLRREAIRRFRLIEKKAKGERKRKMKMVRRLGRERRTMWLEKKRVQRSEKKIKMRKNGLIYEARRIIKKRKLNIFKDERVRKTMGMRVEKEVIGTGCPIKREEKELGGMLHKNGHLNGYSKFKLGQPEGYLVGGWSFEYLYPLNTQTIMSTNGKKTMYRIKLPSFGIIYRYKEELNHYQIVSV